MIVSALRIWSHEIVMLVILANLDEIVISKYPSIILFLLVLEFFRAEPAIILNDIINKKQAMIKRPLMPTHNGEPPSHSIQFPLNRTKSSAHEVHKAPA